MPRPSSEIVDITPPPAVELSLAEKILSASHDSPTPLTSKPSDASLGFSATEKKDAFSDAGTTAPQVYVPAPYLAGKQLVIVFGAL